MSTPNAQRAAPSAAVLAWYNAVPNVLWSALALLPLVLFCYQHVARPWLYGFAGVSVLAYAWPAAWLRRLQLSADVAAYRRLRVPALSYLTQSGYLVNRLVRLRYPHYRPLATQAGLARLHRTSYQQERFHWVMLVFFVLASGWALWQGQLGWAALLTLLNVGYNLYPIWLQQYLRVRLRQLGHGK